MARKKSIWFKIGHAFERARYGAPAAGKAVASLADRELRGEGSERSGRKSRSDVERKSGGRAGKRSDPLPIPSADDLIAAGIALVVDRALGSWGKRNQPSFGRLVRAGAAGAAAALIVDLVRPLLDGDLEVPALDADTADHMLAGLAQGLLYGAVVDPRIPGPPLLKGALYGSVEYMVDPMGGLSGLLGSHTPHRKLPVVGGVLDGLDAGERAYLEHLTFGIALALLYGSNPSSNGILFEEE